MYKETLPKGYYEAACIRFQDVRTLFWQDAATLLPGLCLLVVGAATVELHARNIIIAVFVFLASVYPYFLLHELVHGVVYSAVTWRKVKCHFSWTGSCCELPDIYCGRRLALLCTAAPLIVFGVLFLALTILALQCGHWLYIVYSLLLALHLFGCRSDMYLLKCILQYDDRKLLVLDRGAEQYIYLPR